MDYEDAEHEENVKCAWCRDVVERRQAPSVCRYCMSDIRRDMDDARVMWRRLHDVLERSNGLSPNVVLLMAIAWLAVMLMESFV